MNEDNIIQTNPATVTPKKTSAGARLIEKIRSELNIEKWPAIWQPAKSKNKPAVRVLQREVTSAEGRMVSRVEVGYTQLGTLTTEEQKLLYVLIKLWEDAGKPDVQVFFSTRGLARALKKKGWGTNVIDSVTKSLRKLRTIPVEWINSYFDQTEKGAVVTDRQPFTILGDLRIVERRQDGAVNSSLGYFKFDDHILSNLQLNYTKPVCIEEFFRLKSEIAQLVYSHVDLIMADKTRYERKTKELFDDLGLRNPEYSHMYERKRALERALHELQGIRLSTGSLRAAMIEKTKDGKDYKVVFQKTSSTQPAFDSIQASPVVVNDYSKPKDPLRLQAEELVRHFHKTFHGVSDHSPLSKETEQALSLVSQHGVERSRYVVDFARTEAAKTNFQIQHFGAVLSYAARAVADMDRQRVQVQPARPVPSAGEPIATAQDWTKGEQRLAALSPEQYQVRFEKAKADLLGQNAFLAGRWKDGSKLHEQMIRSRIVRDLQTEPMDLLCPETLAAVLTRVRPTLQNLPAEGIENPEARIS